MSLSGEVCLVHLSGWEDWWNETQHGSIKTYTSVVLFFLSAVLARPIARSLFFLARKFSPSKWRWPDDAKELMMWQTSLLCRAGLLWIAIAVSRLSLLLCQWPQWLFGVSFIIWMDAGGNVLREVIVRKGTVGYSDHEKPGRTTLLYEGTTLAKTMLLVLVVYIYYVSPIVDENVLMRLLFSSGFFVAIALASLPLLRNFVGGPHMFMANMLHLDSRIRLHGTATPAGTVRDAPLGFIVLDTEDRTRTFVPAGETIMAPTEVYHSRAWPLRLDIRLPPSVPSAKVRAFVQDLDELVLYQDVHPGTATTLSLDNAASNADLASFSTRTSSVSGVAAPASVRSSNARRRAMFDQATQEENRVIERARGYDSYIAVASGERWVVQFRTFVREDSKVRFRQARAKYIETIMRMLENQQLGYHADARVVGAAATT